MSEVPTNTGAWANSLSQLCDRLVHPSVDDVRTRARQGRFVGVALGAPLFLSAVLAPLLAPAMGAAVAASAICASFALAWALAILVAVTGDSRAAEWVGATLMVLVTTLVVMLAGGLASPLSALLAALAIEPWQVARSRRAMVAGAAMAGLAGAQVIVLPATGWFAAQDAPMAWHWLVPAAYFVVLGLRQAAGHDERAVAAGEPEAPLQERLNAVTLRVSRNGEVLSVTSQARQLLGIEPEFMLENAFFERIHVTDRVAWLSALADAREAKPVKEFELRLRIAAEKNEIVFAPFMAELPQRVAAEPEFEVVLRRADELAGLRRQLNQMREEKEAQHIDGRHVLASVSHEMRTPLNSIIGFSDMLLQGTKGPLGNATQREYVELVRESGEHLLSLVDAILDMGRLEAGTFPVETLRFSPRQTIETGMALMTPALEEKRIRLACEIDDAMDEICADRRALQQIVVNLLSNAVKFTPQGGEITVGARKRGARVELWVSDNGIGIAGPDLERVGKPFVRVVNDQNRHCEGTGLGLALVKGLVEMQKGSMAIESAPGLGTTVTIGLPLADEAAETAANQAEIIEIARTNRRGQPDAQLRKIA
ncbi:sensor histidine kinase [Mesorhizobium xinjiangense]|uniref:sensor histidine kinase n=1 Tax=Mesorhizobium xinjiangense TaxID=2678685 RepID=UPI0012EDC560|nr:PAS domain-containing sensor histidine kinase [Mesorhizobium xinjiangense]